MKIMWVTLGALLVFNSVLQVQLITMRRDLHQIMLNSTGVAQSLLILKQDYYRRHVGEHVQP